MVRLAGGEAVQMRSEGVNEYKRQQLVVHMGDPKILEEELVIIHSKLNGVALKLRWSELGDYLSLFAQGEGAYDSIEVISIPRQNLIDPNFSGYKVTVSTEELVRRKYNCEPRIKEE